MDFITRIRIRHPFCYFVNDKNRITYKNVSSTKIFVNILVFCNLKTNYVFFKILFTRHFSEVKLALETFLHFFGISRAQIYCDQEGAFRKGETLSNINDNNRLNFLNSREALELQERNDVRFITHQGYHSYLTGVVENKVNI